MRHKKSLRATALLGREAGVRLSREPHFNEDQPRRIRALAVATRRPCSAAPTAPSPARTAPAAGHRQPSGHPRPVRALPGLGKERAGPAVPSDRNPGGPGQGWTPLGSSSPARLSSKGGCLGLASLDPPGALCARGLGAAGSCLFCLVPSAFK